MMASLSAWHGSIIVQARIQKTHLHTWYLSFFLHAHILSHENFTFGKCINLQQNCPKQYFYGSSGIFFTLSQNFYTHGVQRSWQISGMLGAAPRQKCESLIILNNRRTMQRMRTVGTSSDVLSLFGTNLVHTNWIHSDMSTVRLIFTHPYFF